MSVIIRRARRVLLGGIQRALDLYKHVDLDVAIVSNGSSNSHVQQLVNQD